MEDRTSREDYEKYRMSLVAIRNRYFRPVIADQGGMVTHHGDCQIYRAQEVYGFASCTCGLIHDLRWLPEELSERVFPEFLNHRIKSDILWKKNEDDDWYHEPKKNPVTEESMQQVLANLGTGKMSVEINVNAVWTLIGDVFGYDALPRMQKLYEESDNNKSTTKEYITFEGFCPPEIKERLDADDTNS